jgi:hypothetical protein
MPLLLSITAIKSSNGAMRRTLFFCLVLLAAAKSWTASSFIDLSKAANMGPSQSFDGTFPGGEDLKEKEGFSNIPQGPQTFRGIPFQLLDWTENQGKSFIVLKGKRKPAFPEAVALPVGHLKADTLYFLHSCRWGGTASNITVAEYDVIYDDGQVVVVPLRVGVELTNFSGADDTSASFLAWWHKYKNTDMGLSLFPWKNPRPDVPIQTILFKSLNKMPVPILFAITVCDKELPVSTISPKPEKTFSTDTTGWISSEPSTISSVGTAIDMSFLLDAPAGKHGALKSEGQTLVFADGTPARFWGSRLRGDWWTFNDDQLSQLAGRFARYGCNEVSVKLPDKADVNMITAIQGLVNQMKAKGIYIEILGGEKQPLPDVLLKDPAVILTTAFKSANAVWNPVSTEGDQPITFNDDPMVMAPEKSLPAQFISSRLLGSGYEVQWTAAWPNEYLGEIPLLMSAYASFQGWQASLGMSLSGSDDTNTLALGDDLNHKPVLLAYWPIAALAFLRGDLKEGRLFVLNGNVNLLTALSHRSGLEPEGGEFKTDPVGLLKAKVVEKTQSIISDTEQIHWQGNVGVVQISSPRFQAVVGFVGHRKLASPVWQVESPNLFASLSLISLTKTNLWESDHMLLTGVTRMENTGQVYNAAKTKLISQGAAPILVEPLQAKMTLFRYQKDAKLKARALDANGQVLKIKVPTKWAKNNLVISWVPAAFYIELYK